MPLGTLIQLKWPTWPDPQESIGKELGHIPKTKFAYWQATGPALAAYQKLLPAILKVLSEKQGPIPNSDFVWFSLYMVGPSSTTAVPYIMFASEQRTQRRKAMTYIKNSKILQEYPGIQVGEWSEAPHIGSQQQKGTSAVPAHGQLEIPHAITMDTTIFAGDQTSVILNFHYPDRIVKATASVEVAINSIPHYPVPSHVLMPPRPRQATDTEAPADTDNEGFDFGSFVGDEDGSEDDPLATILGSISSSDSDSLLSEEKSSNDSSTEPAVHISPVSSTVVAQPALKPNSPSYSESDAHKDQGDANCPMISIDLDYALCRVTDSDKKVASMRLPDFLSLSKHSMQPDEDGTRVQVLTGHGILKGYLSQTQTHIHLPNSSSYQEVYVAHFSSPVLAGDCGAMVYDTLSTLSRRIFGHIITGSASSTMQSAFVVPANNVHEDITRLFDVLYPIRTPSMSDASHTPGASHFGALSKTLKLHAASTRLLEPTIVKSKTSEEQVTQKLPQLSIKESLAQRKLTQVTANYPTREFPNLLEKSAQYNTNRSVSSPAPSKLPGFSFSASTLASRTTAILADPSARK